MTHAKPLPLAAALLAASALSPAAAYSGPGLGLAAIGVILGLVGTVLLAIVGYVWYPLKRAFARMSGKTAAAEASGTAAPASVSASATSQEG